MILDLSTFVDRALVMFCLIDDLCQQYPDSRRRPGPAEEICQSVLITIAVLQEIEGCTEAEILRDLKPLFTRLPERSWYNRGRRRLLARFVELWQRLSRELVAQEEAIDVGVVDSMPLPVVAFARAVGASHWKAAGAAYGKDLTLKATFLGYRLHLMVSPGGVIRALVLAPANLDDRQVLHELLAASPVVWVLGDRGYVCQQLERELAEKGVRLVPIPKGERRQLVPEATRTDLKRWRKVIEVVYSQLTGRFGLKRHSAHTLSGLIARIISKVLAHTLLIWCNLLVGHPEPLQFNHLFGIN